MRVDKHLNKRIPANNRKNFLCQFLYHLCPGVIVFVYTVPKTRHFPLPKEMKIYLKTNKTFERKYSTACGTFSFLSLELTAKFICNIHLFLTPSINSGMFSTVPISLSILSTAYTNQECKNKLRYCWHKQLKKKENWYT